MAYLKKCFKLSPHPVRILSTAPMLGHVVGVISNLPHDAFWVKILKFFGNQRSAYLNDRCEYCCVPE